MKKQQLQQKKQLKKQLQQKKQLKKQLQQTMEFMHSSLKQQVTHTMKKKLKASRQLWMNLD